MAVCGLIPFWLHAASFNNPCTERAEHGDFAKVDEDVLQTERTPLESAHRIGASLGGVRDYQESSG